MAPENFEKLGNEEDIKKTPKELGEEATSFLRKKGYTWSGRKKEEINTEQAEFERKKVKPNIPPKKR